MIPNAKFDILPTSIRDFFKKGHYRSTVAQLLNKVRDETPTHEKVEIGKTFFSSLQICFVKRRLLCFRESCKVVVHSKSRFLDGYWLILKDLSNFFVVVYIVNFISFVIDSSWFDVELFNFVLENASVINLPFWACELFDKYKFPNLLSHELIFYKGLLWKITRLKGDDTW